MTGEPVRVAGLDDRRVADFRHVGDAGWLYAHGLFVAEGRFVVQRLLTASRFEARAILATDTAWDALAAKLPPGAIACPVYLCTPSELHELTGFNFHRGCLALGGRGEHEGDATAIRAARRVVALEGIGNPDNVGGIFRSAAAFGVDGVLLDPASGDPLYRKAIRTSMGAALRLPFARVDPWPEGLRAWRDDGFTIVATTPAADAEDVMDFTASLDAGARLVLMFGAEGHGLSPEALALAARRVCIRIDRSGDSLNVATAAAIVLHQVAMRA